MRALKLKSCVSILQTLNRSSHISATEIAAKAKIKLSLLKQCIRLLVEQHMVTEIKNKDSVIYEITKGGKKVLKFFKLEKPFEMNEILILPKTKPLRIPRLSRKHKGQSSP
jgi:predicted transcriptional regulator